MDYKDNQEDSESVISDESEEDSEIDEESSENRRIECINEMKELESQYNKLKDDLVQAKLNMIEKKLVEIENETAKDYTIPLLKLKENMEMKINIATLMKEYRMKNVENTYNCEETSAKQTLDNDKKILYDNTKAKLEYDIKKAEEDRRLLYLELKKYEEFEEAIQSARTDLNGKRRQQKHDLVDNHQRNKNNKKPTHVTGPYIVYTLQDYDILEDWSIIKRLNNTDLSDKNNNTNAI